MRIQLIKRRQAAVTFWEVLIVVAVVIALGAIYVTLPQRRNRAAAVRIRCISSLKCAGNAFQNWANAHGDKFPMQVSVTNGGTMETRFAYQHFQALSNLVTSPDVLICYAAEDRTGVATFGKGFDDSHLSYFINRDASTAIANSILAGDRFVSVNGAPVKAGPVTVRPQDQLHWSGATHAGQGMVLLSDCSVRVVPDPGLNNCFKQSGVLTNRLLIP